MSYSSSPLPPPQAILPGLAIAGNFFLWGGSFIDGSLILLLKATFAKEYILPGTTSILRKTFTGIYWPIDFLLDILVAFFWEALDGSHPTCCALGLYFLAQYLPILITIYTDAIRVGNSAIKDSAWKWLLVFQGCGIGAVGPLWALSYFKNSPLIRPISIQNLKAASTPSIIPLAVLPFSILLGYLLPAILMCLKSPEVVSNGFQQKAIVIWNVFPLWVLCIQKLLENLARRATRDLDLTAMTESRNVRVYTLRVVNAFFVALGFASHATFIGIAASSISFPGMWAPGFAQHFSPSKLLVPPFPFLTNERSVTVGDGVRGFFMWDMLFGFLLANLVSLWQFEAVAKAKGSPIKIVPVAMVVALSTALLGPGTTALLISWARDELLFDKNADVAERGVHGEVLNGGLKYPVRA